MRLIKDLIEDNDVVWFYCRTKELAKRFLKQCEDEGFFTLNSQKPTILFLHCFYGVFDNFTMGYLSSMIWYLTFQHENDEHVRIDYEKFTADEENYYCSETSQERFDYSNWNKIAYSNGLNHRKFYDLCELYFEGQSFEEYNAYIFRYLIESSWHYTPEQVVKRMEWEEYFIAQSYLKHASVSECAVEVGYGCG